AARPRTDRSHGAARGRTSPRPAPGGRASERRRANAARRPPQDGGSTPDQNGGSTADRRTGCSNRKRPRGRERPRRRPRAEGIFGATRAALEARRALQARTGAVPSIAALDFRSTPGRRGRAHGRYSRAIGSYSNRVRPADTRGSEKDAFDASGAKPAARDAESRRRASTDRGRSGRASAEFAGSRYRSPPRSERAARGRAPDGPAEVAER